MRKRLSFWNTISRILFLLLTPAFFRILLNRHYQHIWMYDALGALLLGILLEKRWACKNLFFMGSLSSIGSTYSRLIPVIDTQSCNHCGKCVDVCNKNSLVVKFIWNRKQHRQYAA